MVGFAKSKEEFLRIFLELPNGIPSEDTINRVFTSIDSSQLENCFIEWISSIADLSSGQLIAIDGKTIRGAKRKGEKSPIHMVSAWAVENKLHWTLDVGSSEDASRKRAGNVSQNYSVLLKIALNLLKNEKIEKQRVKGKGFKAG
ncbi:MAG: ISAs1 family transposase [Flavobacteriaceae bacterium]|nr:ISAs1 family transposase [Flavobacteriaceae bacterium]